MNNNPIKERLMRGEVVVGTIVNFYAPSLVEIIGYAGVDFMVIDDEHGAFSYAQLEELIRIAELTGVTPLVRVSYDHAAIQKALDRGAMGVHVPMVNTKAEAEIAVKRSKFPPLGTRGVAYTVRAAHFGEYKGKEYLDTADKNTLVIVHIETPEAVENFDDIVNVPGVDVALVGPTDLSVSMGYRSEGPSHPEVKKVIQALYRKGREKGVIMGGVAAGAEDIAECVENGTKYLVTGAAALISAKFKEVVKAGKNVRR